MDINEKKFYDALENIFTGAKIEGEGGFINLLKIKSNYYRKVLEQFKKDIDSEPIIAGSFKEEFFDKLYTFFEKYFSESGSVFFVKTANWQRVYEQVYTDDRDVVLFWKTHMLYYVKSDILFKNINVEITDEVTGGSYNFYFDVGTLQNKKNNEKREIVFRFRQIKVENNKEIHIFNVAYSEKRTKTKIDDIVKKTKIPEEILQKAFRIFKKQATVDFFINKNARKFLEEQLDMYMNQILLAEENRFNQERLNQLKIIQKFAKKIIAFIAQFEDELVRVWNKPKFVLNSNYVITLDKLSEEIINKISNHPNLIEQIKEWIELGIVEEGFNFNKRDAEKNKYLPIDTKYFKDLELDILSLFDNLDEEINGRLIHSENYQALNTVLTKYKEKIQLIYIDPPFNTGKDFDYLDKFQDSTWLSILNDRLLISYKFLSNTGSLYLHLDNKADFYGRMLLNNVFGKKNFINEIVWHYSTSGRPDDRFAQKHDNIFLYQKTSSRFFDNKNAKIPYSQEYINSHFTDEDENGKICRKRFDAGKWRIYYPEEGMLPDDVWDIPYVNSQAKERYSSDITQKPEKLLKRIIKSSSSENSFVLDFFCGSGTAIAVGHKLNRKWIGIELDKITYLNILLPRMKEIMANKGAHEPAGITNDDDVNYKGSGFFKYYQLEQYEDTLRNMKYRINAPTDIFDTKKAFEQYIFFADEKFAHVLEVNGDNLDIDFDKLYPNIDFAETISNLLGLPIKKITKTSVILQDGDREKEIKTDYKNMTNEEKLEFIRLLKPLLWWGE